MAAVQAVERVGDRLQRMHDHVCEYEMLANAIRVGRACDEYDYLWYEGPYSDAGSSYHGHRTLRQRVDTLLLQTGLVRGLEAYGDSRWRGDGFPRG